MSLEAVERGRRLHHINFFIATTKTNKDNFDEVKFDYDTPEVWKLTAVAMSVMRGSGVLVGINNKDFQNNFHWV